jgi:LytS/YehU family sensor histidine kinase
MRIEPETLDARVPNLILQPIVENAIKHGIVSRIAAGEIEIRSMRDREVLRLLVKDNGPGLGGETSAGRLKEGLGLANTRARLQQMYGSAHRFEMSDVAEGGLQVTLEMPFETSGATREREEAAVI